MRFELPAPELDEAETEWLIYRLKLCIREAAEELWLENRSPKRDLMHAASFELRIVEA